MSQKGQSGTELHFLFDPSSNKITIKFASTQGTNTPYDRPIKRLPTRDTDTILFSNDLVSVFKQIQTYFSNILTVYYPHTNTSETFDEVVASMIASLGSSTSVSPNFMETILVRKSYARYYYEVFRDRTVLKDDEINKDVNMLIGLVSYYFMKRLIHVYVMCSIYERLNVNISSYTTLPSTTPLVITQTTGDFTTERNALEARILSLETTLKNGSMSHTALNDEMNELKAKLESVKQTHEEEIAILKAQIKSYRDLLIESTTMIFKLDEIPNVLRAANS